MPRIEIQNQNYFYDEAGIIGFDEGLIGLPGLRRATLVEFSDCAPFLWLASLEDAKTRFVVVEPKRIFNDYAVQTPANVVAKLDLSDAPPLVLTIVKISSDWTKTTVNLRAPLFVNRETGRGAQIVLTNTNLRLDQPLPLAASAAANER